MRKSLASPMYLMYNTIPVSETYTTNMTPKNKEKVTQNGGLVYPRKKNPELKQTILLRRLLNVSV